PCPSALRARSAFLDPISRDAVQTPQSPPPQRSRSRTPLADTTSSRVPAFLRVLRVLRVLGGPIAWVLRARKTRRRDRQPSPEETRARPAPLDCRRAP